MALFGLKTCAFTRKKSGHTGCSCSSKKKVGFLSTFGQTRLASLTNLAFESEPSRVSKICSSRGQFRGHVNDVIVLTSTERSHPGLRSSAENKLNKDQFLYLEDTLFSPLKQISPRSVTVAANLLASTSSTATASSSPEVMQPSPYLGTQGVRVMNPPPSLRIPL